jgi:cytochrome c
MFLLWRELKGPEEKLGNRFYLIAIVLTITVLFMGTGRHVYRAAALSPHQKKIQQKTKKHINQLETLKRTVRKRGSAASQK